jgi:hypothetical protein
VESLVVDVDVRYKPLLKVSELLLLFLRHDGIPLGIPRGVWRSLRVSHSEIVTSPARTARRFFGSGVVTVCSSARKR